MVPQIPVINGGTAEAKVYEAFRSLPDEYRVYHSLSYVLANRGRPAREGEIDFLVIHPDLGLLCLEVKGGRISYEGRSYAWKSTDLGGVTHSIADPFKQAQFQVKDLVELIARKKPWGEKHPRFTHGHGVIFPDVEYVPPWEPIDAPPELVIDSSQLLNGFEARIVRLFKFWSRPTSERLTSRQVKQLGQQVLAPHFALGLTLNAEMAWEERSLAALDDEQTICLDFLGLNDRVLVEGGAGTGKTLLALETARRLASDGADVLLLCYNRALGNYLRRTAASWTGLAGTIYAGEFHELCRDWAVKAGLDWNPPDPASGSTRKFWDKEANVLLGEALEKLSGRYDALIVDEAQDLQSDWWLTLNQMLRSPDHSRIVLFADPAQDLFSRDAALPWKLPTFPLRTNQRNTGAISRLISQIGDVPLRLSSRAPEGQPATFVSYSNAEGERSKVEEVLERLFREGVSPAQIILIGTRKLEKSFLAAGGKLAGHELQPVDDAGCVGNPNVLRYATPGNFKGLEADIVLLCDVDDNPLSCSSRNLYVSVSRARHRLYAFVKSGCSLFDLGARVEGAAHEDRARSLLRFSRPEEDSIEGIPTSHVRI